MKSLLPALGLSLLLAASAAAQSALLNKNIFPEGSFEIYGESKVSPTGWAFPDRNDKPWLGGYRAEVVKGEGGSRELRMVRPDPAENPELAAKAVSTLVAAQLPLPPKLDRARISFRILPKQITLGAPDNAGNGAGLYYRVYDASRQALKGGSGWVGGGTAKMTDSEWQDRESVINIPPGGTLLELHVIFRSAHGEVRIDDIEVVPVLMSE